MVEVNVYGGACEVVDEFGSEGVEPWAGTTHPQKSIILIETKGIVLVNFHELRAIFRDLNIDLKRLKAGGGGHWVKKSAQIPAHKKGL